MLGTIRAQVCASEYKLDTDLTAEEKNTLLSASRAHDMAHLVAAELNKNGILSTSNEDDVRFVDIQAIALFRYEHINYEYAQICAVLEEANIPYMPLKGTVIRKLYPEPWMRTSSDIDILIHDSDIDTATELLQTKLAYINKGKGEHDIQLYSPSGVHLELHFDTVEKRRAVNARSVLQRIWDGSSSKEGAMLTEASDAMFYFYHIAHMAKHFEEGGCGIRFFLDLWLLNHKLEFDREERENLLLEGGLLKFAKSAELLADVWFSGVEHSAFTQKMETYVLGGGIYGSSKNYIAAKQVKTGGKLGYALYMIFLPYPEMSMKYPILRDKKILLPFYHIRRWCSLLLRRRIRSSIDIIKNNNQIADDRMDVVSEILTEVGLVNYN